MASGLQECFRGLYESSSSVTYLAGTTKAEGRFSLLSDRQSLLEEFEQSCPVALRRAFIKDRQIRNRKAVACAGIGLDHMVRSGVGQSLFEADFLLLRKTGVFDRARDIHTAGYVFNKEMRAVGFVGPQIAAVKRCNPCEPVRKCARRGQAGVTAHTIAGGAESLSFDIGPGRLHPSLREQGQRVVRPPGYPSCDSSSLCQPLLFSKAGQG